MTAFDYVVIGIVVASLALGLWRGVIGEIIALVAWVLAFFAAKMVGGRDCAGVFCRRLPIRRCASSPAGWRCSLSC